MEKTTKTRRKTSTMPACNVPVWMGVLARQASKKKEGEKMEKQNKLETVEDVQIVYHSMQSQGLTCRWSGLCVWIESDPTDKQRDILQAYGARWAGKRQKWYFRAAEGLPKDIEFLEVA